MWAWSGRKVEVPECITAAEDEYGAVEYEGPVQGEPEDVDGVTEVCAMWLDGFIVRYVDDFNA